MFMNDIMHLIMSNKHNYLLGENDQIYMSLCRLFLYILFISMFNLYLVSVKTFRKKQGKKFASYVIGFIRQLWWSLECFDVTFSKKNGFSVATHFLLICAMLFDDNGYKIDASFRLSKGCYNNVVPIRNEKFPRMNYFLQHMGNPFSQNI